MTRFVRIADAWGDSWVLRQAVAAAPPTATLDLISQSVLLSHPVLADVLNVEAEMRANRGNVDWWQRRVTAAEEGLDSRHWVFSLLGCAHQPVVIKLADQLNELVDGLAPSSCESSAHHSGGSASSR